MLEKPIPRPLTFQVRGGPAFGHSLRRLFSLDMPSRFEPRHCGQSSALVLAVKVLTMNENMKIFSVVDFILLVLRLSM